MRVKKLTSHPDLQHLYIDENAANGHFITCPVGFWSGEGKVFRREWFIGTGITDSQASIIIPNLGLEQMSDADIVSAVRAASRLSRMAQVEAQILNYPDWMTVDTQKFHTLYGFRKAYQWLYDRIHETKHLSQTVSEFWDQMKPFWEGVNPEAGYVYILSDGLGHYKIGRTKHLTNRIKQLSTQPPFAITLIAAFTVVHTAHIEKMLHETYAEQRLNGEWFSLSQSDIDDMTSTFGEEGYITEDSLIQNSKTRLLTDGKGENDY